VQLRLDLCLVDHGMDIHPGMAFYSTWTPTGAQGAQPHKLLPTMPGDATRYLAPTNATSSTSPCAERCMPAHQRLTHQHRRSRPRDR